MEQYERSGPPIDTTKNTAVGPKQTEDLAQLVERQDRRIQDLEREMRKLRTDLRTAINAFNSVKNNG